MESKIRWENCIRENFAREKLVALFQAFMAYFSMWQCLDPDSKYAQKTKPFFLVF